MTVNKRTTSCNHSTVLILRRPLRHNQVQYVVIVGSWHSKRNESGVASTMTPGGAIRPLPVRKRRKPRDNLWFPPILDSFRRDCCYGSCYRARYTRDHPRPLPLPPASRQPLCRRVGFDCFGLCNLYCKNSFPTVLFLSFLKLMWRFWFYSLTWMEHCINSTYGEVPIKRYCWKYFFISTNTGTTNHRSQINGIDQYSFGK